jgi:hypothetical protein
MSDVDDAFRAAHVGKPLRPIEPDKAMRDQIARMHAQAGPNSTLPSDREKRESDAIRNAQKGRDSGEGVYRRGIHRRTVNTSFRQSPAGADELRRWCAEDKLSATELIEEALELYRKAKGK